MRSEQAFDGKHRPERLDIVECPDKRNAMTVKAALIAHKARNHVHPEQHEDPKGADTVDGIKRMSKNF